VLQQTLLKIYAMFYTRSLAVALFD
jgi:hypothetical protein